MSVCKCVNVDAAFLGEQVRWRWDFAGHSLPRLVSFAPESAPPVPVRVGGARSADEGGHGFVHKLPERGSLVVGTAELHQQLGDEALAAAWSRGPGQPRVDAFTLTLVWQEVDTGTYW